MSKMLSLSICFSLMVFMPPELAAQEQSAADSEIQNEEIVVIGRKIEDAKVLVNINRRTRAVKCRPQKKNMDPVYANLKCEGVRRCAHVEPYSRANVRACFNRLKPEIAEQYLRLKQ